MTAPGGWAWKSVPAAPAPPPSRPPIFRALAQAALMMIIAGLLHFRWHRPGAAVALSVMAGAFILLAGLAPRAFHVCSHGVNRFAAGLGKGLNYLLLAPFFYLVFVPGRWLLRARGRDPLGFRFPAPEQASFWIPREGAADPAGYRRQH